MTIQERIARMIEAKKNSGDISLRSDIPPRCDEAYLKGLSDAAEIVRETPDDDLRGRIVAKLEAFFPQVQTILDGTDDANDPTGRPLCEGVLRGLRRAIKEVRETP